MPVEPSEYEDFLHPGDAVNVSIDLPDKKTAEHTAVVVSGESGDMLLKLCGSGFLSPLPANDGTRVFITRGDGKSLFQCCARLKEMLPNDLLTIALPERVSLRERRQCPRADVKIPVNYSLPSEQSIERVEAEWETMRGRRKTGRSGASTHANPVDSRVNLSGNGLRFKMRDCFSSGTLLHLDLVLPGPTPEHIHAVGSVINTTDLVPEMSHIDYYATAMAFRMIDSRDRHKIMNYVISERHKSHTAPPHSHL